MRSRARSLGFGALVFCSAIIATPAHARPPDPLTECRLESSRGAGSAAARCGYYETRENRDDPNSRRLRLHVARIPALRLEPASDPLFILSGGPGQAASDFYLSLGPAFARIRRDRDIVLVDQRGTGRSNRLDCTFPEDLDVSQVAPARLEELVQSCLATMQADPRYYTTSIAVRDLDDVRAWLGYETVNLYGISYGTRVAQHYLRRYPDRVRAVILDGIAPPELALGPDVAIEAQRALDRVFTRCAKDSECAHRFPDIARHFQALRERLGKEQLETTLPDPLTADQTRAQLGTAQLGAAVRLLTYSDVTVSTLPLLIHEAQVDGRPEGLAAQYLMIQRSTEEEIAYGMHFAVVCSEDAPRWHTANVSEEDLKRTYLGTSFMDGMRAICESWPRGPVDPDFSAPLESDRPVLLLSGSNDPVTPARYGEQAKKNLQRAKHLILKDQGHGQIAKGCVPRLAAEFIATASFEGLDTHCVERVAPAPFMLSRSASAP